MAGDDWARILPAMSSDADAVLEVKVDPRSLDPVRLLLWELNELRGKLRLEGLTEHADTIDGMLDRLERFATETETTFWRKSDDEAPDPSDD